MDAALLAVAGHHGDAGLHVAADAALHNLAAMRQRAGMRNYAKQRVRQLVLS